MMKVSPGGLFRAALMAALALAQIAATPHKAPYDASWYTRPQKMVNVNGGRRMNIICTGTGSPTVILEAGQGADSTAWRLVQPVIDRRTRVCAVDRAGMGFSDFAPAPRDGVSIVNDLHALLAGAHAAPPYVLVGWSSAGLYARLYADRYRSDVVGMVLVDPDAEDETQVISKVMPSFSSMTARLEDKPIEDCAKTISRGSCALFPGIAKYRQGLHDAGCPRVDPPQCAVVEEFGEHQARPAYWREEALEVEGYDKTLDEVRAQQRPYGDLPLIILTESLKGDLDENAAGGDSTPLALQKATWRVTQPLYDKMARLSSVGVHFWVDSPHAMQLYHPYIVTSAIEEVIDQARYNRGVKP